MGSSGALVFLCALVSTVVVTSSTSNGNYISREALEALHPSRASNPARRLIGFRIGCPVNFDRLRNYTLLTRTCRPPRFDKAACCEGLRAFSCPFAPLINNRRNDCAESLFHNINVRSRAPPGLFTHMCVDTAYGMAC